jgi:hypothetical protein
MAMVQAEGQDQTMGTDEHPAQCNRECAFRACTTIIVENGKDTKFWHDHWLQGQALKNIAPEVYKLAWQKNIMVAQGISDGRWKRGLQRIATTQEINQFARLWHLLQQCVLTNQSDAIEWRFSTNRVYSAKLTYRAQFEGAFADFHWDQHWQTKAEAKCKFFGWLILQNKLWTADHIIKHGGQANSICQLCYVQLETAIHLLAQCAYSKAIWTELAEWSRLQCQSVPHHNYRRLKTWWRAMAMQGDQGNQDKQSKLQKLLYIAWNIWKERCRRIYDHKALPPNSLTSAIKSDVHQWHIAWCINGALIPGD